ncbi:MAG: hypothetical protein H0W17_05525 [Chloroflexi bacterium]|nr:hypothetical protein [Chloroflexota bacterium]
MNDDHEDQHSATDDEAGKSSGGLTGGDKSLSADGTTSGGLGSGANSGTGGAVGNWDEADTPGDQGDAGEDQKIVYPAGTGPVGSSDWNARQSGSGRESDPESPDEGDSSER